MGIIVGTLAFNFKINFPGFIFSFIIISAIIFISNTGAVKNQSLRKRKRRNQFVIQNGSISVLKKSDKNILNQDLQIMPVELIEDGKILYASLSKYTYEEEYLLNELKKRNINDLSEVSYAIVGTDGKLYIFKF